MTSIYVRHSAIEYLVQETGVERETAEHILEVCITLCMVDRPEKIPAIEKPSLPLLEAVDEAALERRLDDLSLPAPRPDDGRGLGDEDDYLSCEGESE